MQVIDSFRGEYGFLSNFHKCKVEFEGMTYPSVEHAFQAAKNPDPEYRRSIAAVGSPVTAKRMGKKTALRPDWEEVKEWIIISCSNPNSPIPGFWISSSPPETRS